MVTGFENHLKCRIFLNMRVMRASLKNVIISGFLRLLTQKIGENVFEHFLYSWARSLRSLASNVATFILPCQNVRKWQGIYHLLK